MTHPGLLRHELLIGLRTFIVFLILAASIAMAHAESFDIETFRQIDPEQLRLAEERMDEYIEPGTTRLLRQPENAAERYVVARQTRLAEKFAVRPQWRQLPDGTEVMDVFWPAARATSISVDEHGQVYFQCLPAIERLGGEIADFRRPESAPAPRMVQ